MNAKAGITPAFLLVGLPPFSREWESMNNPSRVAVGSATFVLAVFLAAPMASASATDVAAYISSLFTGGARANALQGGYNYVAPANQSQTGYAEPVCRFEKQWVYDPYVGAKIQKSITVCS
jgi:hypothetical protein